MEADELKRAFGRRLQRLREAKGVTQEELAGLIGRSPETVGNIERGVNSTRLETMALLSRALEVEMAELFETGAETLDRRRRRELAELQVLVIALPEPQFEQVMSILRTAIDLARGDGGPSTPQPTSPSSSAA